MMQSERRWSYNRIKHLDLNDSQLKCSAEIFHKFDNYLPTIPHETQQTYIYVLRAQ